MSRQYVHGAALGALLAALVACGGREPATVEVADNPAWSPFVLNYLEQTFKAQPLFAVSQGRHEFDGMMPDWSKEGIAAEIQRLGAARDAAQAFVDAVLSPAQRFERDYLIATTRDELFWLSRARFPFRNPAWYVNQLDPEVYLSRNYAPLETRLKAYIGYARAVPGIAAAVRANLELPQPRSYVDYAVKGFGGYADFYASDVPKVFATVQDAGLQKELAAANAAAVKAMRELRDWFKSLEKTASDNYALGPELFAEMVRETEGLELPLAAIEAAGRADLARNKAALQSVCGKFAPGQSLSACVAKVQANKPTQGVVELAREQLAGLKAFVIAKDIVTIPGTEEALVQQSPPYNSANSAYITIPGPYEKGIPSVYNISAPDPSWSKAEQNEYIDGVAEVLNTSVHEIWPGHFLQFLHSNRSTSPIAQNFVGYAFAEGWAHYAEELMWELGLDNGSDELRIAQLIDALWRDVRLLSAIGLHTQGMSVAASEKLFMDESFSDVGTARQQAARGTYDPAYLNYTLGKLMIKKLRDDWVARELQSKTGQDARALWKSFHDRLLSYGGPPIPLIRRELLGTGGEAL